MDAPTLVCQDEQRRHEVRKSTTSNGLDYLEVGGDQSTELKIYFLRKASEQLKNAFGPNNPHARKHIRFEGGRRVPARDLVVTKVDLITPTAPEKDDYLVIQLKEPGDFSIYTLSLVKLDDANRPTAEPMEGIDPRYYQLKVNFKEDCPSELDCKPECLCPPEKFEQPEIDYLAKDYASFRQLILDRLSQIMPDWQERHIPDLGIALVEILAYAGDHLSYFQDAVATEAYLDTARQRISVRRHARLVDYHMHEGCNARTWIVLRASADLLDTLKPDEVYFITDFAGAPAGGAILKQDDLRNIPFSRYEVFEPLVEKSQMHIQLYKVHNTIRFYTWGDAECCLPRGATSATLWDVDCEQEQAEPSQHHPGNELHLRPGDVLIFEEIRGPKTGNAADADAKHRHAVRLTAVTRFVDPLNQEPVVEIEWAAEDALPFPLCISTIGPAPECELLQNLSVARGNVILADHGWRWEERPGRVKLKTETLKCACECEFEEPVLEPELFRPHLQRGPLTFGEPLQYAPASKLLKQYPAAAQPHIELICSCVMPGGVEETRWLSQPDLLRSQPDDPHFVVEMDNESIAHLRFGDGQSGRRPGVGESFAATYRVGNGVAGNIGAETIAHVVTRDLLDGVQLWPRNPFPASGGVDPEPLAEVKLFAPTAFRKRLERAITPEDYAELAQRHPRVQRAAAMLRWTGSWYEMLVAIDPLGKAEAEADLLQEVETYLQRFRRMGHDLRVRRAQFVALDVAIEICVLPGYLRGHVKAELLRVFGNKVRPDGSFGFFHPDNWSFGVAVRLSNLYAAAQAVPGVESVDIIKFERLFEGDNGELENSFLPIAPWEIARLDNDPSFPENGRLQFIIRGGR